MFPDLAGTGLIAPRTGGAVFRSSATARSSRAGIVLRRDRAIVEACLALLP